MENTLQVTEQSTEKPKPNINGVLARLRELQDKRDALNAALSEVSREQKHIEFLLVAYHEEHGVDKVTGSKLTVTFNPAAMRVNHDPEKFSEIMAWAVRTNNEHIFWKQFASTKVCELIENGVALPEGLSVEPFLQIKTLRLK